MSYRLWVLVAGLLSYTGCLVWFQDPTVKMLSSLFCAFVIGIGIVLVSDKFEHLEKEVAELQEQVAQAEKVLNVDDAEKKDLIR